LNAAPLLEEEWNFGSQALTPDISDPFLHDRSCAWTLLEFTTISIILAVRNVAGVIGRLLLAA
jgi:hypothetical protein